MAQSIETFDNASVRGAADQPITTLDRLPSIPANTILNSVVLSFTCDRTHGYDDNEIRVKLGSTTHYKIQDLGINDTRSVNITSIVKNNNGTLMYTDGSTNLTLYAYHEFRPLYNANWNLYNITITVNYSIPNCDLNYDNLLSFTNWTNSPSSNGCNTTGNVKPYPNGTVVVDGSGDFYTLYYTGDSLLYYIPVQAGQQYLFRFDADIIGGVQAYVFYFNDSYATVNNASGVYFDGIYGSNNLYFTPPSGCTKITFRIGTTNGVTTTFSNLAIYKTS